MKRIIVVLSIALAPLWCLTTRLHAQTDKPSSDAGKQSAAPAPRDNTKNTAQQYSGTYAFLNDGEFVQLTVEDDGRVTGFISRFGDDASDKGAFLDQFFKTAKLDGNKLTFTTQVVHGVDFEFKGSVERGDGKNPGDEGYFVLKGSLTQNRTDANKKSSSHSQDVTLNSFPQNATPTAPARN